MKRNNYKMKMDFKKLIPMILKIFHVFSSLNNQTKQQNMKRFFYLKD